MIIIPYQIGVLINVFRKRYKRSAGKTGFSADGTG
jgi:hypothetical protein